MSTAMTVGTMTILLSCACPFPRHALIDLDAGALDDVGPLRNTRLQHAGDLRRHADPRLDAGRAQPLLDRLVVEGAPDLTVQPVDDLLGRARRPEHRVGGGGIEVPDAGLLDGRDAGEIARASAARDRER